MAMASASDIRQELAALGEERLKMDKDEGELAKKVRKALGKAYGKVSVTEAANLLHIHRTTVYRVYKPHQRKARTNGR